MRMILWLFDCDAAIWLQAGASIIEMSYNAVGWLLLAAFMGKVHILMRSHIYTPSWTMLSWGDDAGSFTIIEMQKELLALFGRRQEYWELLRGCTHRLALTYKGASAYLCISLWFWRAARLDFEMLAFSLHFKSLSHSATGFGLPRTKY